MAGRDVLCLSWAGELVLPLRRLLLRSCIIWQRQLGITATFAALALVFCNFGAHITHCAPQNKKVKLNTVLGIDLGKTYSCVSVYENDDVEIIAIDQVNPVILSYAAFAAEERLFRYAAKNPVINNQTRTTYDVKRLGRK